MYSQHPLQHMASPARSASLALHLAGVASFSASLVYVFNFLPRPEGSMGGPFQFFTNIGLSLSLVTFVLGTAADLTLLRPLFAAKNTLSVCAAPYELLVSLLYWGMYAISPGLAGPPDSEMAIPMLADISFHLAPAVFLLADRLLFSPPLSIRLPAAAAMSLVVVNLYWGWTEFCFSYNKTYPYPVFNLLSTSQRALLFACSALLMTGNTAFIKWLSVPRAASSVEKAAAKKE